MAYIGSAPSSVVSRQSSRVYRYEATAGQTVFQGADLDNQVLNVTPSDVEIHMNGLLLDPTDYTVTSTSVTLSTPATAGDELTVTGMQTFEVADTYSKTTADARYVNVAGDTISGNIIANGSVDLNPSSGVTVSRGLSHDNTYEGGRITLKNGSGYTKQYGIDTYYENLRIFRENSDGTGGLVQFEIDGGGRVLMPYQPAFSAIKADNNNYPALGALQWTEISDIGNNFNGVRFTAPVSGFYHFEFGGITQNVTNYFYIGFLINGSNANGTIAGGSWRHLNQVTGNYDSMHTSLSVYLSANDYVEAATGYNGGSPYLEQYRSSFSGYLIG